MSDCDKCGSEVSHVWRHRAFESETHRRIDWVCRTCHPDLPDTVSTGSESGSEKVALTDGGTATFTCPSCAGSTVNGQGLFHCTDCTWSGEY